VLAFFTARGARQGDTIRAVSMGWLCWSHTRAGRWFETSSP